MLSGFNTNIRHRGVLFHVQSEDSGRDPPHIITHLFHGGNILFSQTEHGLITETTLSGEMIRRWYATGKWRDKSQILINRWIPAN